MAYHPNDPQQQKWPTTQIVSQTNEATHLSAPNWICWCLIGLIWAQHVYYSNKLLAVDQVYLTRQEIRNISQLCLSMYLIIDNRTKMSNTLSTTKTLGSKPHFKQVGDNAGLLATPTCPK